jgi:predicted nucleotidyltransferase
MELRSSESVMAALGAQGVRFLVVGGMAVVNLYSDTFRTTPIDLFVTEPFDFATAFERAHLTEVAGVPFRFVDLATLIAMKEAAGRPVDLDDVRHLRLLLDEDGPR